MSKADRFASALARKAPGAEHQQAAVATSAERLRAAPAAGAERHPVAALRRSPFQPVGRPSAAAVQAVEAAIAEAGTLAALMGGTSEAPDAEHPAFRALGKEARELALLAADVQTRGGLDVPVEVRLAGGALELVSGHRRAAAARLAGLTAVPVVNLGALTDAEAAELVYRRNRLREDFTAWQDARSILALGIARGGASRRTLAPVAGYSHAHVGDLLNIAGAWLEPETGAPRAILRKLGSGDEQAGEEVLAGLSFRTLRDLAKLPERERLAAARVAAGLEAAPDAEQAPPKAERVRTGHAYRETARGLYELRTTRRLDELEPAELTELLADLQDLTAAVRKAARAHRPRA